MQLIVYLIEIQSKNSTHFGMRDALSLGVKRLWPTTVFLLTSTVLVATDSLGKEVGEFPVILFDSPPDISHSSLEGLFNRKRLSQIIEPNSRESLLDRSNRYVEGVRAGLERQINELKDLKAQEIKGELHRIHVAEGGEIAFMLPHRRMQFLGRMIGESFHGSWLSGLIGDPESNVRIYPISSQPAETERFYNRSDQIRFEALRSGNFQSLQERAYQLDLGMQSMVTSAEEMIRRIQPRVASLAMGTAYEADILKAINDSGFWPDDKVVEFLNLDAAGDIAFARSMKGLFERNPEVLFVVAAGNDGVDIGEYVLPQIAMFGDLPNVIVAGASTANDPTSIAELSNFSNKFVHVLARGEDVVGPALGQIHVKTDGTSASTGVTVREVINLALKRPDLSAAELKRALLNEVALSVSTLYDKVQRGRVLFARDHFAGVSGSLVKTVDEFIEEFPELKAAGLIRKAL